MRTIWPARVSEAGRPPGDMAGLYERISRELASPPVTAAAGGGTRGSAEAAEGGGAGGGAAGPAPTAHAGRRTVKLYPRDIGQLRMDAGARGVAVTGEGHGRAHLEGPLEACLALQARHGVVACLVEAWVGAALGWVRGMGGFFEVIDAVHEAAAALAGLGAYAADAGMAGAGTGTGAAAAALRDRHRAHGIDLLGPLAHLGGGRVEVWEGERVHAMGAHGGQGGGLVPRLRLQRGHYQALALGPLMFPAEAAIGLVHARAAGRPTAWVAPTEAQRALWTTAGLLGAGREAVVFSLNVNGLGGGSGGVVGKRAAIASLAGIPGVIVLLQETKLPWDAGSGGYADARVAGCTVFQGGRQIPRSVAEGRPPPSGGVAIVVADGTGARVLEDLASEASVGAELDLEGGGGSLTVVCAYLPPSNSDFHGSACAAFLALGPALARARARGPLLVGGDFNWHLVDGVVPGYRTTRPPAGGGALSQAGPAGLLGVLLGLGLVPVTGMGGRPLPPAARGRAWGAR